MNHDTFDAASSVPADATRERTLHVLHVCGSPTSAFHHELSLLYARSALRPAHLNHRFAVQDVDGGWRSGPSLDALSAPMTLDALLGDIPPVDLVVPYQFCPRGMSENRVLFEHGHGLPVVGSDGATCALATDKSLTRTRVAASGVRVAPAALLDAGDPVRLAERLATIELPCPLVVKPNREDNSVGVTLVRERSGLAAAVAAAARHDDQILLEAFVPGREIRVALVELDGRPVHAATIEYTVSEAHPLRETGDKLDLGGDGNPVAQRTDSGVRPICPATLDEPLADALREQAWRAHRALGCRDYSLFDFRVHERSGEPYLLEAGLFWTFGRISILSGMLRAAGHDVPTIAERVWRQAAARGAVRSPAALAPERASAAAARA